MVFVNSRLRYSCLLRGYFLLCCLGDRDIATGVSATWSRAARRQQARGSESSEAFVTRDSHLPTSEETPCNDKETSEGAKDGPPAQLAIASTVRGHVTLIPTHAHLEEEAHGDPIEVLWQRPTSSVRAVVLLLHGCKHQATDFWPQDLKACPDCLGLPEELTITRAVLSRSFLALAVTSRDRASGCWNSEDLSRVESAISHVYKEEKLSADTPLYAFGASSGGAFVGQLAETTAVGQTYLKCRIPQIMNIPGTPRFVVETSGKTTSWSAPPTLMIHMPRDERTAKNVRSSLGSLWEGGVTAAQLECRPLTMSEDFFSSRISGITNQQSQRMVMALKENGFLDKLGQLNTDPRSSDEWRDVLRATKVPQYLGDTLEADKSSINEEMNVAWAQHEMCATYVEEMLDFCENPAQTCKKHGWTCAK